MQQYGPRIVTNGLVLYFDGASTKSYSGSGNTLYDISGKGNNGTLVNSPTFYRRNGGYFDFNGTNQYINTNLKTSDFGATYTISVWCKRDTTNTHDCICGENYLTSTSNGILFWFTNSGLLTFGHFKTVSGDYDQIECDLVANSIDSTEWHNYTVTRQNGVEHKLYVDGVLIDTVSCSSVGTSTYNLRIAYDYYTVSNRQFDGKIGTFSMYNRVLEPEEVLNNYNALKNRFIERPLGYGEMYFGVRRIDVYNGPCMKVRRSSDNLTKDIYFDYNGNLDTGDLLDFVGANSGYVDTWYDQTGRGRNATQSSTSAQPRIVSSGTLDTTNGKPTLVFSGSQWLEIEDFSYDFSQLYALIVAQPTTSSNRGYAFGQYDTNSARSWIIAFESVSANGGEVRVVFTDTGLASDYITYDAPSSYSLVQQLVETQFTEDTAELWIDGSSVSGTYVTSGNVDELFDSASNFTIGRLLTNSLYFIGNIQECGFWDDDRSGERTVVANNINNYYSIY